MTRYSTVGYDHWISSLSCPIRYRNNATYANKARILRDYGQIRRFDHEYIGLNSRLDEIQAAVLGVKLKYLNRWNNKRKKIAGIYQKLLQDSPIILPVAKQSVWHLFVIRTKKRNGLQKYLARKGIGTQIHYPKVMYLQKALRKYSRSGNRMFFWILIQPMVLITSTQLPWSVLNTINYILF